MDQHRGAGEGRGDEVLISQPQISAGQKQVRRWELGLLLALLVLSSFAYVMTHALGKDMRLGLLTTGSSMGSMDTMAPMAIGLFMATWTAMMVAMMFPAIYPVVALFKKWAQSRGRPPAATGAFVLGYLAVWSAAGAIFFLVQRGLERWVPAGNLLALRTGGAIVILAGVYQLTPVKQRCLTHCRGPMGILIEQGDRLSRGYRGPLTAGAIHGKYCLGCCLNLMVVLVLLGMMNLVWMGVIASVILAEKVLSKGKLLSRGLGFAMVSLGALLVVGPHALPAFV
jgi:predicted metal-binding membrane protein